MKLNIKEKIISWFSIVILYTLFQLQPGIIEKFDVDWTGCKFGKIKIVNDSTFECTATYTMYFRGHRRDVNVDYGYKTKKTITTQITYKKTGPTERWIVLLGDIKVDEIVPLPSTKH